MTSAAPRTKLARVPVLVARLNVPASPIGSAALQRRAQSMLAALRLARAELSLVLCDDPTIHALNRRHRRKDKPTDVLAFAMREGAPMPRAGALLGDVVISLETAGRQAREHEHSLWTEVTLLLAHGLLHLVGYDHRTDDEEAEMNRAAARLVRATRRRAPRVTPRSVDNDRRRIVNTPQSSATRARARSK